MEERDGEGVEVGVGAREQKETNDEENEEKGEDEETDNEETRVPKRTRARRFIKDARFSPTHDIEIGRAHV